MRYKYERRASGGNLMWAIILRHGLADGVIRTYEEVAEMIGLSKQRVHQLLSGGLGNYRILCAIAVSIVERLLDDKIEDHERKTANLEKERLVLQHLIDLEEAAKTPEDQTLIQVLRKALNVEAS